MTITRTLKFAAFGMMLAATSLHAQLSDPELIMGRAGSWDFSLPLIYSFEGTIDGEGGSKVEVKDDLGFGFGGAFNLTDRFSLGGFFNWNSRVYDATAVQDNGAPYEYNNRLETTTIGINASFFLLEGPVTPFVTGNVGYTFTDTNIQDGPTEVDCYWDPWWGYTCDGYVPTRSDDGASYSVGVGLRIDVSDTAAFQLSYNSTWYEMSNATSTPNFDSIRLDFIFRSF